MEHPTCEHCGGTFAKPNNRGPTPKYCSAAHRQRAYELRRELGNKWYCTAHGVLAGEENANPTPTFCWFKNQCEIVLVALRQIGAKQ